MLVVLPHVQKGLLYAIADSPHDLWHQNACVPCAEVIWMGANGAELRIASNFEPLARQRDNLSTVANPDVAAKFMRARSQKAPA